MAARARKRPVEATTRVRLTTYVRLDGELHPPGAEPELGHVLAAALIRAGQAVPVDAPDAA